MMLQPYKRRKSLRVLVIAFLAAISFVILNVASINVRNFFFNISNPVQKIFWKIGEGSSDFLSPFFVVHKLSGENSNLVRENQQLLASLSELENSRKENKELREALEVGLSEDFKMVYAQIISKDDVEDSILLDKGEADGIMIGMPAINQQRVLYGNISEVFKNYSRVLLISNKNFISDVRVQGKNIFGVIKGQGNLSLYLELIPQEADLMEGDILETSGLKGSFPKNLFIGKVGAPKKEDTKSFQEAQVRPSFDVLGSEGLFIVTNFKN